MLRVVRYKSEPNFLATELLAVFNTFTVSYRIIVTVVNDGRITDHRNLVLRGAVCLTKILSHYLPLY